MMYYNLELATLLVKEFIDFINQILVILQNIGLISFRGKYSDNWNEHKQYIDCANSVFMIIIQF